MALIKKTDLAPPAQEQEVGAAQRDFEGLLELLQQADPAQRRWAVQDLAAYPQASPVLVAQVEREADLSVREVIFSSLIRMGDEAAVAGLVSCLKSEDAGLRNEAIEALKQLPREIEPLLSTLLHDPDPDVRIFVVNVLESLRHPLVEQWLIEVIRADPHVNVCATAVDLLGEVGVKEAIPALQELKQRFANEPYIQFAADIALKRINEA